MEIDGVALVVCAGGIGRTIAATLAIHGAKVLVCADINLDAANQAVEAARQGVSTRTPVLETDSLQVDVTDETSVQNLVDKVKGRFGRIDYFVNSSGFGAVGQVPISSHSLAEYRKLDEVHNIGTFLLLRAALTCMQKQEPRTIALPGRSRSSSGRSESRGSIVILASLASEGAFLGVGGYIAAKHAVAGLVQTCALENGRQGIRINAVSPSYVSGPMMNKYLDEAPAIKAGMLGDLPLGRLADPEEVADTIAFLCSGMSSYINGHTLVVDGGASVALSKGQY